MRLDLLLVLAAGVVLGLTALLSQRSGSSSARAPSSPRPAAVAFGSAYLRVLQGSLPAAGLPDASPRVLSIAANAEAAAPGRPSGGLAVSGVRLKYVTGSANAQALIEARGGARSYPFDIGLAYLNGRWRVMYLVPPDIGTVRAAAHRPGSTPAAIRRAASSFATGYADYRELATRSLPAGLPALRSEIVAGRDPLAGTAPTRVRAQLRSLAFGPQQGDLISVSAALDDRGAPLSFTFILQRAAGGWEAWQFPRAVSP